MPYSRDWFVTAVDPETGELDREAVVAELVALEAMGHRLGGGFIAIPLRRKVVDAENSPIGKPLYEVVGWVFSHTVAPALPEGLADEIAAAQGEVQVPEEADEPPPAPSQVADGPTPAEVAAAMAEPAEASEEMPPEAE